MERASESQIRFWSRVGGLIGGGVPWVDAFALAAGAVDDPVLRDALDRVTERMREGDAPSDAMGDENPFSDEVVRRARVETLTKTLRGYQGFLIGSKPSDFPRRQRELQYHKQCADTGYDRGKDRLTPKPDEPGDNEGNQQLQRRRSALPLLLRRRGPRRDRLPVPLLIKIFHRAFFRFSSW